MWTKEDRATLSDKYLQLMIHTALERADYDKDKKAFYQILYGGGEERTRMLIRHIQMTEPIFGKYHFPIVKN